MHPMLNIGIRAARNAGNIIAKAYENLDQVETQSKGANDYVTNIDKAAERTIIETIQKSYPEHGIVAEESGITQGANSDFQWVIDPLDGTTNFIKGIPHFAVSVALQVKGKTEHAVIYDPLSNELFTASRGQGAQLNGYRLRVTKLRDLEGAVIATGLPFKQKHLTETYFAMLHDVFEDCGDIRRAGSAALDLAYVAAGRLDGYFELGLKPWDLAAGELIVREAGALVTDVAGGYNFYKTGNIVTANPKVLKEILSKLRPHLSDSMK
ncbi:inositol-1-monophosphatase [Celerinatantimonas diazotrophica]|uniref:Inositol-1-monophosphatase n=1 Tax=Celerinatantimonas diazotrophica TaxID=412034 RepID=A0A4R1JMA9_9GAMM|nr:inositol-1-monophosphatase [Celerinatantimonas diazotrophica]TCK52212.1 myo-inositol-1(or 4)-monophosphatase [Celerinatantimonas diazotrophica]CAG9296082.1 Inositol-1-monophosphatase [Celerinatantimonas diazotrophica]